MAKKNVKPNPKLDREAWQRVFGNVVDTHDPSLDRFTADDYQPPADAVTLHGEDAAAFGRHLMESVAGGPDMLERAMSGRGHPTLGTSRAVGESPRRVVRLETDLDSALVAYAKRHDLKISEVIRNALRAYISQPTH